MSRRLRTSVETILRLTPAVLGSTVFSIAGACAAHACLDDQARLAAREAIGSSLQTLGSVYAVLLAFVVFVVSASLNGRHAIRPGEHAIDAEFEALPARDDDQFLLDLVLHPLRRGDGTRLGGRRQRSALLALAAGGTRVVRGTTELRRTPEGLVSPLLRSSATAGARVLFGRELEGWVSGTRVRTYALVLADA